MTAYTTQQKLEWMEHARSVEAMVQDRAFLNMLGEGDLMWRKMWCSDGLSPTFGTNSGWYLGLDAIGEYFEARGRAYRSLTDGGKSYHAELMSCPVVEIAGDMQTAKGLWYSNVLDICRDGESGAVWRCGRLGVDLIRENGEWKLWHMLFCEDFSAQMGRNWKDLSFPPEPFRPPEPNGEGVPYEHYSELRPNRMMPNVPRPYFTFADTFSYGTEAAG